MAYLKYITRSSIVNAQAFQTNTVPGSKILVGNVRIHLGQILFNPAYYDSELDLLEEPAPSPNIDTGSILGKLRAIDTLSELLGELRSSYISHITKKICDITRWSITRGANVLIFPEYSVPIESVSSVREISKGKEILIVAGTHRVRLTQDTRKRYTELGVDVSKISNGAAIAPVIYPDGSICLAPKRAKSKWEPNLYIPTDETPVFEMDFNGNKVTFVVTPCIDSLRLDTFDFLKKGHDRPNMVFCPALSPATEMFDDMGKVLSSNEIFFALVNSAAYGGSGFNVPEAWLKYVSGVKPLYKNLPKNYEAILEIDIETDSYFIKKGTVNAVAPCSHPRIFPIVYRKGNDWIGEFEAIRKDTLEMLRDGSPEEAVDWIDGSLSSQEIVMPEAIISILRDCRHRYLALYGGDIRAVEDALTLMCIADDIIDTRRLFAKRVNQALDILMETFRGANEEPSDLLLDTLRELKRTQIQIGPTEPEMDETGKASAEALDERISEQSYLPSDSTIAGFQDRGPILDELREIIIAGAERVIVITGMLGVGKTELVNTLFLKALTDWHPIWVNVATNASVARIVCEIGAILGITMDVDSLGSSNDEVFRKQVRRVVTTLYSTERNAFIIDDLRNLVMDHRNYLHLQILMETLANVESYKGNRVFLISSVSSPPLWMQKANVARIHVRGLEDKFLRRVLEYQLREARLIPGEMAADIPQSLLNSIDGHPLAAKIAAIASEKKGLQDLSDDMVLSEVETTIISLCLPRIELSPEEINTIRLVSVFRQPIDSGTIKDTIDLNIEIASSLASKAIFEYDGRSYVMHPLIRKYYYTEIPVEGKKEFHKKAASYYSKLCQRDHLGHFTNPTNAFELVYHLALAGDLRELFDLRALIYEEMYPAARAGSGGRALSQTHRPRNSMQRSLHWRFFPPAAVKNRWLASK